MQGFASIRAEDKQRVLADVARGAIGPPPAAAPAPQPPQPVASGSQKRKRESVPAAGAGPMAIYDDDDEEEDVGNADDGEVVDELYATIRSDVVGVKYYKGQFSAVVAGQYLRGVVGLVGMNERVLLERERNNQYDANAVKVFNATRDPVGHLPRDLAKSLAALLDQHLITVEGTMLGSKRARSLT